MTIYCNMKTMIGRWGQHQAPTWRALCKTAIVATLILSFATATKAEWGEEVKLSTPGAQASLNENMGQCLIASDDTLHAVWVETEGKDRAIHYRSSADRGATWGKNTRLSPTPGVDSFPLLAQSGKTLHLVFFRNGNTPQAASYYKRSTDGGMTWGPDVLLGETKFWPGVAAAESMVYVSLNTVYADDAKNSVVYFRRSTDNGATWEEQQPISTAPRRTGGRSEDPAIMADGKTVQLVWNDNRDAKPGMGMAVYYRRSLDMGKTWKPEVALTAAPAYTYFPSISLAGSNVGIVYGDRQSGHYDIYRLHSPDLGETWGKKEQVTETPAFYPVIVRAGSVAHMAWTAANEKGGMKGVMYRRSGDGGKSWAPIASLAPKGGMPFLAAAKDAAYLIFRSDQDGHSAIYFKCDPTGNKAKAADPKKP